MKKMLCMLLASILWIACSEDGNEVKEITLKEGISNSQTVYADETQKTDGIKFTAVAPWTATVSKVASSRADNNETDWLKLSAYSGSAGEHTLSLTLSENTTGLDRKAEIRIVCGETTITIIVEQKATTQTGDKPKPTPTPEPEPEPTIPGVVKKINEKVIEYHSEQIFTKIGTAVYLNKAYSANQWAYLNDAGMGKYEGWRCYFTYGNNGLVDYTEYYPYRTSTDAFKTKYLWEGNKVATVYDTYYNEKEGTGVRLDIQYGDTKYLKGNIDINWLVINVPLRANHSFKTSFESAIGVESVKDRELVSKIIVTDLSGDKYSATITYRYEFNQEGYVTEIYEKTVYLLGGENDEKRIYLLEY